MFQRGGIDRGSRDQIVETIDMLMTDVPILIDAGSRTGNMCPRMWGLTELEQRVNGSCVLFDFVGSSRDRVVAVLMKWSARE